MATDTHTTVTLRLDLSGIIADLRQLADALEATQTKAGANKCTFCEDTEDLSTSGNVSVCADCRSEAETADDDH